MGLAYDPNMGFLYSIGEDSMLKVTDLNLKEPVYEEQVGSGGLKVLVHDKENKRLFLGDGIGGVYIYGHKNHPPECLGKVLSKS